MIAFEQGDVGRVDGDDVVDTMNTLEHLQQPETQQWVTLDEQCVHVVIPPV